MHLQLSYNQSQNVLYVILIKYCNICNYMLGQSHPMGWVRLWPKIDMFHFVCELEVEGAVTDA